MFYQKFGPEYNILRRREWKIKYFIFFSPGQIRSCLRAMRLRNDDIGGTAFDVGKWLAQILIMGWLSILRESCFLGI